MTALILYILGAIDSYHRVKEKSAPPGLAFTIAVLWSVFTIAGIMVSIEEVVRG